MENVENVVSAPIIPVPIKSLYFGSMEGFRRVRAVIRPSIKLPVTFTKSVP